MEFFKGFIHKSYQLKQFNAFSSQIKPIGPYSVIRKVENNQNLYFLSGSLGLDPKVIIPINKTNELISQNVDDQFEQVIYIYIRQ